MADSNPIVLAEQSSLTNDPPEKDFDIKFFFINPPAWVQTELVPALIRSEIPVYLTSRHDFIPRICRSHPRSIIYINAERTGGSEKLDWIRLFEGWDKLFRECRMTIIFLDRGLGPARQAEIRKPGIPMAFVELNQAPRNIFSLVYTMAIKLNEKCRRRAIRVTCDTLAYAPSWNAHIDGLKVRGHVRDISSSGMAAFFPTEAIALINEGADIKDIQLQLKGSPVLVHGTIAAVRAHEDKKVMITLFRWGDDKRSKEHIHQYIGLRLQDELARLLT